MGSVLIVVVGLPASVVFRVCAADFQGAGGDE